MNNRRSPHILGIETSCDETAASVIIGGKIESNIVFSQQKHAKFKGIVPELASREHVKQISSTVEEALQEARISPEDVDIVSFTESPGLLGSLLVGIHFAKGFAFTRNIPLIGVDHLHAHVFSLLIDAPKAFSPPYLCLLVSGGHTQLVRVKEKLDIEIVGTTRDDAAGEAFDKIAVLLGLGYPGGHRIDKLARKGTHQYSFPKAKMPDFDFSFSGFKTAVRYFIEKNKAEDSDFIEKNLENICCSVQETICDTLVEKTMKASNFYGIKNIGVAGGVSANSYLREKFSELKKVGYVTHVPDFQYCTDNAAMIAFAGKKMYEKKQKNEI